MRNIDETGESLLEMARNAAKSAYCPYSHFPVGAAVETELGIFTGCNVENASYGLSICAERIVIFTAVAAGARRFDRMAVSCIESRDTDPITTRMCCGACRQVIAEFLLPDCPVIIDGAGVWTAAELLPKPFQLSERPIDSMDKNS